MLSHSPQHMGGEQKVQREIIKYLHMRGIVCWKAGVGGFRGSYKGKERFIKFGVKGQSDIIGLLPGGRFLAIEVKTPTGRLTKEQNAFLTIIAKVGGLAGVARSVIDAHHLVKEALHGPTQPVA